MTHDDAETVAACNAIEAGDYAQARHHLNNLSMAGGHHEQVDELTRLILQREQRDSQSYLQKLGTAIAVTVLGYAVLSFQSPAAWGQVVWGLATFLVLPLLAGALASNSLKAVRRNSKPQRFWLGFGLVSVSVAIYTIVGMAITRSKMASSDKNMDALVFMCVALVYGAMAGLVSGFAASTFPISRRKA